MSSRRRDRLAHILREWDWDTTTLAVVFALVLLGRPILATPLAWAARVVRNEVFETYDNAMAQAAIKRPSYIEQLDTIDINATEVHVVSFRYPSLKPGKQPPLMDPMWVALPDKLKKACEGNTTPKLRLQQVLGLPPRNSRRSIYEITATPANIFRPCISGQDPASPSCSLSDPSVPAAPPSGYDRVRYVSMHAWESYQTGVEDDHLEPGDYPYKGFPFTGMGWTYDWSPQSKTHVGVSEFVIEPGAEVTVDREVTLEEFCAAKK